MKNKLSKLGLILLLAFLIVAPMMVFAQGDCVQYPDGTCIPDSNSNANPCSSGGLREMLCKVSGVFSALIPVLIALGVVYFVWGVVQYFINDNEEAKKAGKERIFFGIIGLTVIVGLWGLVYIILDTFEIEDNAPSNSQLRDLLPRN